MVCISSGCPPVLITRVLKVRHARRGGGRTHPSVPQAINRATPTKKASLDLITTLHPLLAHDKNALKDPAYKEMIGKALEEDEAP